MHSPSPPIGGRAALKRLRIERREGRVRMRSVGCLANLRPWQKFAPPSDARRGQASVRMTPASRP